MSCSSTQIKVRRNADVQIRYVSQSRSYNFTNLTPRLSVREGPVEVLSISVSALPSGSVFEIVEGEAILRIDHQDIAALAAGVPATDRVSYSYDVIFTDLSGFDNWILGGEFVVVGINELSSGGCGGCDDGSVEINVGGQCLAVSIDGGTIGMIGDAPSDGVLYGRMDAQWVAVPPPSAGGGIPDAPADGDIYARQDNDWVPIVIPPPIPSAPFTIGANVSPPLEDGEVLFYYTMAESVDFPVNFAGSEGVALVNPSAPMSYYLRKNGVNCCEVTVSTSGVVVFIAASAVSVVAGDVLSFVAQASPDSDCVCGITFKGARV